MSKKTTQRRLLENEAMAMARRLRTGPRKLNLVANLIRGLPAEKALAQLSFSPRRISGEVKRVLMSAIANAENNHQLDVDQLVVSEASVGRAFKMRRWRARARGRGAQIEKPFSNLTIIVRENEEHK